MVPRQILRSAYLGVVLALSLYSVLAPASVYAAQRTFQFHAGNSDNVPYDIDPDPCHGRSHPRFDGQGHLVCGDPSGDNARSRYGTRRPGPSAFGLQFDSGNY